MNRSSSTSNPQSITKTPKTTLKYYDKFYPYLTKQWLAEHINVTWQLMPANPDSQSEYPLQKVFQLFAIPFPRGNSNVEPTPTQWFFVSWNLYVFGTCFWVLYWQGYSDLRSIPKCGVSMGMDHLCLCWWWPLEQIWFGSPRYMVKISYLRTSREKKM